jgi:hypothetical protein
MDKSYWIRFFKLVAIMFGSVFVILGTILITAFFIIWLGPNAIFVFIPTTIIIIALALARK